MNMQKNDVEGTDDEFDMMFPEDENDLPMMEIMEHLFDASREQTHIALSLTELIVENGNKSLTQDEIFSIYENSLKAVERIAPVERLLDNLPD